MLTVKDIARHCNVSPSTVSNILNNRSNVGEDTRLKVLRYVQEIGYRRNYFAQSVRRKGNGSKIISIITEGLGIFGTSQIAEAVMAYCSDNGYRTLLTDLRLYARWSDSWFDDTELLFNTVNPAIREAQAIRVDGIIYIAGHCRTIDCFPPDLSIPIVVAYGLSADERYPSIIIDDETGGYETGLYLIKRNHKRIGIIAGRADNHHTIQRLSGYQKALYENNILYDPSLVHYGNWRRLSGYQGAERLVNKDITALFCLNDEMAAGAYDYLYEHNIPIGNGISVIGYDNMELSDYLYPHLTTSEIQLEEIGRKSAQVLIDTLGNQNSYDEASMVYKIPCKMIERESVRYLTQ